MNLSKTIKFGLNLLSKHLFLIIIISILVSFFLLGYFLYRNFYQTLYLAEPIYISSSDIVLRRIDINSLNKVIAEIEEKNKEEIIDWSTVKNPFIPYE